MQLSEFKAWFEGYTEGLEAAPTKAQFDRIKEKVKEITGTPVTYPVYVDRYVDRYWRAIGPSWSGGYGVSGGNIGIAHSTSNATLSAEQFFGGDPSEHFDSHTAMYALGKAEAQLAA